MTSLIKNQIIKRLSKFFKNLSSNQINLSAFKGEGELSSIQLDEKAIEDLIELPIWLKIEKATCGRVFIKIPWTNLKTLPIQLQLDDVIIEIQTCEKLRHFQSSLNTNDPLLGKYGFINRAIDGISLSITNLTLSIKAQGFRASIYLPSLDIYSVSPTGKRVNSLIYTRLRNAAKDHILLFKEISCPNVRIEASSNDNNLSAAAIRLIVNSCRINISMKKNLQDSTMVTSRVMVEFDDLLSVINDAQLKSALDTYDEITKLMKQASEQRRDKAGDQLKRENQHRQPSTFQPKGPTVSMNGALHPNDPFTQYDIIEISLHLNIKRLDFHMITDSEALIDRVVKNGALQMTMANLSINHYPYHEFGSSKSHWIKYNEIQSINRSEWVTNLHQEWNEQFNMAKIAVPTDEISEKFEKILRTKRIRLFESCSVINIDDIALYPVSLNNDKQQKRRRPFITSDRTYYQLPDPLGVISIQYTEYYYPLPYAFPVPDNDIFIQMMPFVIRMDFATLIWLDAFISTTSITIDNSGLLKTDQSKNDSEHVAIQFEAILPRIVISSDIFSNKLEKTEQDKNFESNDLQFNETLEFSISKISLTNTRTDLSSNQNKLEQHLKLFKKTNFFHQTQWPLSNTNNPRINPIFEKHPFDTYLYNNPLNNKISKLAQSQSAITALQTYYTMTTDSLKKSAKNDIWHFGLENIYLDFKPFSSNPNRLEKQNMIDTLSLTGWLVFDETGSDSSINILCVLESPTILKISQKQYTFLMRLSDELILFFDALGQNQTQTRLIKEKLSLNNSTNNTKITICLSASTTFVLAVIDDLNDEIKTISTSSPLTLPEIEDETTKGDTLNQTVAVDLETQSPFPNKLTGQKKSKFEENNQRSLRSSSRSPSISSSMNMSDIGDETSSRWDSMEDLDADLYASFFNNVFEQQQQQQQKPARIEVDDDYNSVTGKNLIETISNKLVNGVFVKLNQINICITEHDDKIDKPMYISCNVKHIRIDEFSSIKFNNIKQKLFENQPLDEFNNENVPPINLRLDLPKNESSLPPTLTLQIQDRILTIAIRAIDILTRNFEEKNTQNNQPTKILPIYIHIHNLQLTIFPDEQTSVEIKPPIKLIIEFMNILRQSDGQLRIQQQNKNDNNEQSTFNDLHNKLQQFELIRLENERLQAQINAQRVEIDLLHIERDSLVNRISKLDIELTQSGLKSVVQQESKKK